MSKTSRKPTIARTVEELFKGNQPSARLKKREECIDQSANGDLLDVIEESKGWVDREARRREIAKLPGGIDSL